jgi:hypothetical protein
VTISCAGSDRKTQQKVGRTDSKTQKAIGQTKEAYFDKSSIMISKLVTAVLVQLGGPLPGFPQKEHFLCWTSTAKALREGPNIQRTTARPRLRIADELSHHCYGGPCLALELHPL